MTFSLGFGKAIPKKVRFTWLVARNACMTRGNLQMRGMAICGKFPLCKEP